MSRVISSGLAEKAARAGGEHETRHALRFGGGDPPPEGGEAVVAAPLVVARVPSALRLRHQAGFAHAPERAVQGARLELDLSFAAPEGLLHDRVAVPLAVAQ